LLPEKIVIKLKFFDFLQCNLLRCYKRINRKLIFQSKLKRKKSIVLRDPLIYQFAKSILLYKIRKNIIIEDLIKDLDITSQKLFKRIVTHVFYVYTHPMLNIAKLLTIKAFKREKELNKFLEDNKRKFNLPKNSYSASVFYYHCGLKFVPKKFIQQLNNKDFIDGGAFIGDSALVFERNYKPNTIVAFEPETNNFKQLLKTIKLNNLLKIVSINKAIGEKEENLKIVPNKGGSAISDKGTQEISIISIDDFVYRNNVNLGLIKMDLEGYALIALKGATKSIKSFKPILLIAIYHNGDEFFEILSFIKQLNLDYKIIIRKLNPSSIIAETTIIAWVEK
jgi:FkbM family methyltransferase